jgi:thymidine phosphorylase
MAIKQTHIYRGHAIVHQVFSSDLTHEKIERFVVGLPGKNNQLSTQTTLADAKASVDELLAPRNRFITTSA